MPRASTRDKLIAKLAKLVTVTHTPEVEDIQPEDSFQFPDDVAQAKEMAQRTIWGWCCVKTTAEYAGFKGTTYLGGCNYESAEDFARCEGEAQTFEACAALLDNITEVKINGALAAGVLRKLGTK